MSLHKTVFPILFALVLLAGCRSKQVYENEITLIRDSCLKIPIGKDSRNLSFCIQFVNQNNKLYLAVINDSKESIEIYDIKSKSLYNTIKINQEGDEALPYVTGFVLQSLDSIFLISPAPKIIALVNSKGEVKRKYNYEKDSNGRYVQSTLGISTYRVILKDSLLFLNQVYRARYSNGILTDTLREKTNLWVTINSISGKCSSSNLTYPKELVGKDISGMEVIRALGYKNEFIYNFGVCKALYRTENNNIFKQYPIESNYTLRLEKNHARYISDIQAGLRMELRFDEITDILYDKFRCYYYVVVRQRAREIRKDVDLKGEFVFPNCMIIILDKELKHLGEVFFQDNKYSFQMMFVAPEGLYISEDNPDNPEFNEDIISFRLFKIDKTQRDD